MNIAHLARAENELLASPFEDKLGFVFREHVRGAIVLLRQLLLPLHHFAGEANDHVVLIDLSVDRDGTERGPSDLHGLILVPSLTGCLKMHESRAIALRDTLLAFRFTVHATRLPRAPSPRSGSAFSPSRPQKRSTGLNSRICSEDVASGSNRWRCPLYPRNRTSDLRVLMSTRPSVMGPLMSTVPRSSRRRAHASVRGRRRGRHTMLSEGAVSLSRYAWFVG